MHVSDRLFWRGHCGTITDCHCEPHLLPFSINLRQFQCKNKKSQQVHMLKAKYEKHTT